ncbi:glutathione S-transferase [Pseudanabaena sp. PCC 6802]|uniref:glutathione S-transferase n=1 Tax=Pseudanabaena sp. PCC 6802 TaxID=118173 RepID=UPI0003484CC8|nr:glutathione S-transferase [Pseudanabaena sp. PCC 6802]
MNFPILYSFNRCPYAIRARMALAYAGITCELREVALRNKPAEMLAISPKGTTPVLQLLDGQVLEESLDIMYWAIEQHDPAGWQGQSGLNSELGQNLITANDRLFKPYLDRYKYAVRFPEQPQEVYRGQAEIYLQNLDDLLRSHQFLISDLMTMADVAIFPFVRQFAHVDLEWFYSTTYKHLQAWLTWHESSTLFLHVMQKRPAWRLGQPITLQSPLPPQNVLVTQ